MRRKVLLALIGFTLSLAGSFLAGNNVFAYWSTSGGKDCFSIQYATSSKTTTGSNSAKEGNTKTETVNASVYSTQMICVPNGGGKNSTMEMGGYPAGSSRISDYPKLSISKDGKTAYLSTCSGTGLACDSGKAVTPAEFPLSKYNSFKELGQAIANSAPGKYSGASKVKFEENTTTQKEKEKAANGGTSDDDEDGDSYSGDPCYNANMNSQGWLLCPTIRNLEYTAGSLDNIIEGWLSVDTELYDANSATAVVWETMRSIANIIMVIILLVIIFSQLTGVGIDNYGIKKMLPRLIAMAILINLSLVICELAIDISNLLGTGLRNLFGAIGQNILAGQDVADYMESFVSTMVTVLLALGGVAGAVAPTALSIATISAAEGSSTMIGIIIVLALLIVVAAVLVFFVMLGARMVIIIGCVAAAPVALALYVLPNTQNFFKKWLELFKTALVIFPICGAVGGISWIIKAIVLTSSEIHIWMGVVGIVSPFLVFFMLPSMLKGVLGALGQVGAALSSMGSRVEKGAGKISDAVQDSARFKEAMAWSQKNAEFNRAANLNEKIKAKQAAGKPISDRERSRLSRAQDTMVAYEEDKQKAAAAMRETNYDARVAAVKAKAREGEINEGLYLAKQNGITFSDGSTGAYGLGSIERRMGELKSIAATQEGGLNENQKKELATLSLGAVSEPGGGGVVSGMIRSAKMEDQNGNEVVNKNFMDAMGEIYQNDANVKSKLNEKDAGAALYTENFMTGGSMAGENAEAVTFDEFKKNTVKDVNYNDEVKKSTKTYEGGISQSGTAQKEYLESLTEEDFRRIVSDEKLMNGLARNDMEQVLTYAAKKGVTDPRINGAESSSGSNSGRMDIPRNTGGSFPDNMHTETWD